MSAGIELLPEGSTFAFSVLLSAVVVGIIIDQLLFRAINSRAAQKGWATGRQLAKGLHGLPTTVGLLLGLHLALLRLNLDSKIETPAADALRLAAIIATTAFAARILSRLVRAYTEREGSRLPSTSIFVNLARGLVWVLGLISVLAALGVSIAPLITALGVGGLAVGLALQPTLENVFSGIQVLASRQIEPGDLIRLESGEEGSILDVTWRNTTILTATNDVVIVPNAVLGRSRITNFSTVDVEHVLTLPVIVPPGTDANLLERCVSEVALEVCREVPGTVREVEPSVRFAAMTPAGLQVNVGLRVASYPERVLVRHELIRRLQVRLAAEGIEGAAAAPVPQAPPAV